MDGILGKKIGMTSVYDNTGKNIAVTVVEVAPNVVTQVKSAETDGYEAVQMAAGEAKIKRTSKALLGHFNNASTTPKKKVVEFKNTTYERSLGEVVRIEDVFEEGDRIAAIGTSKGKGFQGVVKRHHFSGVGQGTHGQHNRLRAPGSIGASSYPSKVVKGMRMAGRMGGDRVKMKNLSVVKIFPEQNIMLIKGAVPGHKGSFIIIEKL